MYFQSSLDATGRNFACLGESVAFSCLICGDKLSWDANTYSLGTFRANGSIGEGFTCHNLSQSCQTPDPCYIFSAVLDYNIHLSNGTNRCYSTMTITPVKLDEKTSERSPCTRNELMDSELNITCRDLSQQDFSTLSSLKFKLAGKYKTI